MHENYKTIWRFFSSCCEIFLITLRARIFRTYTHYEKLSFMSLSYMHSVPFAWIIHFSCSQSDSTKFFAFIFSRQLCIFLALAEFRQKLFFPSLSLHQHQEVWNLNDNLKLNCDHESVFISNRVECERRSFLDTMRNAFDP